MRIRRPLQILSVTLILGFLLTGPAHAALSAAPVQVDSLLQGGALYWSSFLGGPADCATVDANGNTYVAGSGGFVAKMDSSGTLLWHTILGGGAFVEARGIEVDGSGNVM